MVPDTPRDTGATIRLRSTPDRTLAVLALCGLSFALLQSLVAPALRTIQVGLSTTESSATWVLTSFLLSAAVATPILGRLGDVYGKRGMMLVALAGLAVGCTIDGLSSSLGLMITGRVVQGLGGGVFPLAFGIIRDELPPERVPGSIGLLSALLGLGAGLGVVLSGVIVEALNFHYLFWCTLAVVLAALAGTALLVPAAPGRAPGRVNWTGAALMSAGLSAVLIGVSRTSAWGWSSLRTIGLLLGGAAVLALWIGNERRSADPLVDMRVMAIRGVWTTNLLAVLLGAGTFTAFVLIPQFAQASSSGGYGFDATVTEAGAMLLPFSLVMLFVGSFAGRIERRVGSKASAATGTAFALLAFILLLSEHEATVPMLVASALLGVGIGLAFAAMANLVVQAVPPTHTGVATGMNTVARSVGGAFGAQVAATFLTASAVAGEPGIAGYNDAFRMGIVALILGLLVIALHPGRGARGRSARPRVRSAADF